MLLLQAQELIKSIGSLPVIIAIMVVSIGGNAIVVRWFLHRMKESQLLGHQVAESLGKKFDNDLNRILTSHESAMERMSSSLDKHTSGETQLLARIEKEQQTTNINLTQLVAEARAAKRNA